ncbi:MAG TPA: hypothetical protein VLA34_06475 [Candidatus Krumholzibacterium sp.]|nr:hypothetical protein [Candidatus Krumholzibacterium sp.]
MKKALVLSALIASCSCGAAFAHGAHCRVDESALMVEAAYHDGSPMSFCDVTVKEEGTESIVLSGSTDDEGRFFFIPAPGRRLIVEIDDGMGHQVSQTLDISERRDGSEGPGRPRDIWLVVIGVGAIFGAAGLYMMIRSRRG